MKQAKNTLSHFVIVFQHFSEALTAVIVFPIPDKNVFKLFLRFGYYLLIIS